ncbi:MAG: hypothetical protein M1827_005591 [Pycnora praestabilis]|nr:MAG: hypothetical protein M1827_005591 [Pycnora praestabilis]
MTDPSETDLVRSQRLLLRPIRKNDAEKIFPIRSHWEVMKWSRRLLNTELSQTQAWIDTELAKPNHCRYIVELLPVPSSEETHQGTSQGIPQVIGIIAITGPPEIGYMFHRDFWGKGYATEAVAAFLQFYWRRVPPQTADGEGYDFADAKIDPENGGSLRVAEKCGFTFWMRLKDEVEIPALGLRDAIVMRVPRPGTELVERP